MSQEIKFQLTPSENTPPLTVENLAKFAVIFNALITSGGLSGIRGGKTIIHFDGYGEFVGVQLDYWPWRKRQSTNNS